jgi:hypothetical protein
MDCRKIKISGFGFFLGLLLCFQCFSIQAQTWSEFFQQKKTQKQYLLEQVIALKVYAGYLEKGYEIAGDGLGLIRDFKNGEFGLHGLFFSALKAVSPLIKDNPRMVALLGMEASVLKTASKSYGDLYWSNAEAQYISSVQSDLKQGCGADLEALLLLVSAGKLEMSDDERLKRFDALYLVVGERYTSARDFDASVCLLLAQKTIAIKEFKQLED